MALNSVLAEVCDDKRANDFTKAMITALWKSLKINRKTDIPYIGWMEAKKTASQSRNKFFVNCLPNYVYIDQRTFGPLI